MRSPPLAANAARSLQSAALVLDAEIPSSPSTNATRTSVVSVAIVELHARLDLADRGTGQLEGLGAVAALVTVCGLQARRGGAQLLERLAHLGLPLGGRGHHGPAAERGG